MTPPSVAHDTFVIERSYDAPVAQVFEAWADPKLKAGWFVGSVEALGAGYDLDFRVGGREVNRGGPPGGPVFTYEARFHDIVPERRHVCRVGLDAHLRVRDWIYRYAVRAG